MLHIASAIIKTRRLEQEAVRAAIAAMPGADIVAAEAGRVVVVLEADHSPAISDMLDQVAALQGVLSATLVFEHAEPEEDPI
ncbi:MAG TPA: chaperone NapD [Acetobacteraceae bacterium]|jgi:nitrate reductase NapD